MREPLVVEGGTGIGKSHIMSLYALLVNSDPRLAVRMRRQVIAVLNAVAVAQETAARAAAAAPPPAGAAAGAAAPVHGSVGTWSWLTPAELSFSATPQDIVSGLRLVVSVDPEPRATEVAAALVVRLTRLFAQYPLLRDAAGEALTRLHTILWAMPADLRARADAAAKAAEAAVPREVVEEFTDAMLDEHDGADLAAPVLREVAPPVVAPGAAAAAAGVPATTADSPTWSLRGLPELEQVLGEVLALQPKTLYRRIVAHEGLTYDAWARFVAQLRRDAETTARLCASATLVVFVDELNTAGAIGAVSEAVAAHCFDGVPLPRNVIFVAAINPRRPLQHNAAAIDAPAYDLGDFTTNARRPALAAVGAAVPAPSPLPPRSSPVPSALAGPVHSGVAPVTWAAEDEGATDYMDTVSFVVKPLPACLEPLVVHQTGMAGIVEEEFLRECLKTKSISDLDPLDTRHEDIVVRMIAAAQSVVRSYNVPRIHLSIRCLLRALRLYAWLRAQELPSRVHIGTGEPMPGNLINPFLPADWLAEWRDGAALVVAVALAYWCRLPSSAHVAARRSARDLRSEFSAAMGLHVAALVKRDMLPPGVSFSDIFQLSARHLWDLALDVPVDIVGTSGLQEALYAVVVGVHTRIAVLLTGPPGCGKTLSFLIALANLRGSNATSPVFRFLRHTLSEAFQCSEQTEASEVVAAYTRAVARQRSFDSSRPGHFAVVLSLDEAGLPKERRQAIKGLHDPLEQRVIGAVFMSNTTLDAAKTSRMLQVWSCILLLLLLGWLELAQCRDSCACRCSRVRRRSKTFAPLLADYSLLATETRRLRAAMLGAASRGCVLPTASFCSPGRRSCSASRGLRAEISCTRAGGSPTVSTRRATLRRATLMLPCSLTRCATTSSAKTLLLSPCSRACSCDTRDCSLPQKMTLQRSPSSRCAVP